MEAERVVVMQGLYLHFVNQPRAVVVTDYVPVENSSPTPGDFIVKKASLVGINYIVGFMHSHDSDSPNPSPADLAGLPEGQVGAVWCDGELEWYTASGREEVVAIPAEN